MQIVLLEHIGTVLQCLSEKSEYINFTDKIELEAVMDSRSIQC